MPQPPIPHLAAKPAKSRKVQDPRSNVATEGDTSVAGAPSAELFVSLIYNLACTTSAPEADRRSVLENALEELTDMMSDTPTLPHAQQADAQRSDLAVGLPTKHCAFQNCSWSHSADVDKHSKKQDMFMQNADQRLIDHLMSAHKSDLQRVAK